MSYVATINIPGYLPMDDEPPTFDTAKAAWNYLRDEYWNAVEGSGGKLDDDADAAFVEQYDADEPGEGCVNVPTPGYDGNHDLGLAYCVTKIADGNQ